MRRLNWIDVGIGLVLSGISLGPAVHLLAPGIDGIYFGLMPGIALAGLGIVALVVGGIVHLVRRWRGVPVRNYEPPPPRQPAAKRRLWIDILAIAGIAGLFEVFLPHTFLLQAVPGALAIAAIIVRFYFAFSLQPKEPFFSFYHPVRRKMLWAAIGLIPASYAWVYLVRYFNQRIDPSGQHIPDWLVVAAADLPALALMTCAVGLILLLAYSKSAPP